MLDERETAVAIEPFAVGQVGRHRRALGILAVARGAGSTCLLAVEDLLALGDLRRGAAAAGGGLDRRRIANRRDRGRQRHV